MTASGNGASSIEAKTDLVKVGDGIEPSVGFKAEVISTNESRIVRVKSEVVNGFTVQFTDLSSSLGEDIVEIEWDFGDGIKSNEQNLVHTYNAVESDVFTVSLSVETAKAEDSKTKPAFVSRTAAIVPGLVIGEVTDSTSGIIIVGVTVALKKTGETLAGFTTTDEVLYVLEAPSGNYTLSATKEKFSEFTNSIGL